MTDEKLPMSNTEFAVARLRDMIFSGELAAGSDHLETELAEKLKLSRTPIREAVLLLSSQGLLAIRPRKGVRIASLSVSDMEEIYQVLTELESLSAWLAAKKGYKDSELSALADAIDAMDRALEQSDLEAWAVADDQFHASLLELGGNRRIMRIVGMMADQIKRARSVTLHIRPLPVKSNDDHRLVYEAIARGDAETAKRLHYQHRQYAGTMLVSFLEKIQVPYV
ncbi:GntR family transcriptional regulator [Litoreibacter albidus]|uniref:GntR family transcriptional regulator n=1 Tax=Litoreibacter albidus TaxID=670155 RepID=UPI001FCD55C8|nr:GntR family transcriptional regulator [Litoreibacter albidus]